MYVCMYVCVLCVYVCVCVCVCVCCVYVCVCGWGVTEWVLTVPSTLYLPVASGPKCVLCPQLACYTVCSFAELSCSSAAVWFGVRQPVISSASTSSLCDMVQLPKHVCYLLALLQPHNVQFGILQETCRLSLFGLILCSMFGRCVQCARAWSLLFFHQSPFH